MKYVVNVSHYTSRDGYINTETMETGCTDTIFPASDWNLDADPFVEKDGEWVEICVEFYADDADPSTDDPIHTDTHII